MPIPSGKATCIVKEEIDPRGRYITVPEFQWIMNYFKDRYDPRRLALALCYTCGFRIDNAVNCKRSDFNQDFTYVKMKQCKPHVRCKDKVVRINIKSKNHPLPEWLSADLRGYINLRIRLGYYNNFEIPNALFPCLRKSQIYCLFNKLREKYGKDNPWLLEVWYKIHRYGDDGKLIATQTFYRCAPHAGRAHHARCALDICDNDLAAAKILTTHERVKDVERYTKYCNVEDLKQQLVDKYMNPLLQTNNIPLAKSQKTLKKYFRS